MRQIEWSSLDAAGRREALARPKRRSETRVGDVVRAIFDDVEARGGEAVAEWAIKLDGAPPRVAAHSVPELVVRSSTARVNPVTEP